MASFTIAIPNVVVAVIEVEIVVEMVEETTTEIEIAIVAEVEVDTVIGVEMVIVVVVLTLFQPVAVVVDSLVVVGFNIRLHHTLSFTLL